MEDPTGSQMEPRCSLYNGRTKPLPLFQACHSYTRARVKSLAVVAHRDWILGPRKHQGVWGTVNSDSAGNQGAIPIQVHTRPARAILTLYHPFKPYPILHLPLGVSPGSLVSRMSHTLLHPESAPPLLTAEDTFQEDGCNHQQSGRSGVQFSGSPSPLGRYTDVNKAIPSLQCTQLGTDLMSAQDGVLWLRREPKIGLGGPVGEGAFK